MRKKMSTPQFITNGRGKRTNVILDIKLYNALVEELEDLHDTLKAERRLTKIKKVHTLEEIEKHLFKHAKK